MDVPCDVWISVELKHLLDDTQFWIDHTTYPPDEIAVRFKHRIVSIHCFPNGNGRHTRLMGDIIVEKIFKRPVIRETLYIIQMISISLLQILSYPLSHR